MKKSIIISGPKGSGKTRISEAIALTHSKVLRLWESQLMHNENSTTTHENETVSLIIIDGCTLDRILLIENIHRAFCSSKSIDVSIVYLTQEEISLDPSNAIFYVINCNNRIV